VESGATLADQAGRALDAISTVVRQSAEPRQEILWLPNSRCAEPKVWRTPCNYSNITRQTSQGTRGTVATVRPG